jgi:hypothetical protein
LRKGKGRITIKRIIKRTGVVLMAFIKTTFSLLYTPPLAGDAIMPSSLNCSMSR